MGITKGGIKMDIALFKDVTTEEFLVEIEAEGKKYEGLYVDMDNAPERKYVKDKASTITALLKTLDRARIDKSKQYKLNVEAEASSIKERLQAANEPFTLLIDEHKEKRAKILADKKASEEAQALLVQIGDDHEVGLLMNKTFEFDREQELKAQLEHEKQLTKEREEYAEQQVKLAEERRKQSILDGLERERNAENARLANVEHVRAINKAILFEMCECGLDTDRSMEFIKLIAKKQIPQLTINY